MLLVGQVPQRHLVIEGWAQPKRYPPDTTAADPLDVGGAGGRGYGLRNAQLTAELYGGLRPAMVNTSMLTVVPGTPLSRAAEKGLYEESTETEKLQEVRELVRCLGNDTVFMSERASNLFHVRCRIPEAKGELLAHIDRFMAEHGEAQMRRHREMAARAF